MPRSAAARCPPSAATGGRNRPHSICIGRCVGDRGRRRSSRRAIQLLPLARSAAPPDARAVRRQRRAREMGSGERRPRTASARRPAWRAAAAPARARSKDAACRRQAPRYASLRMERQCPRHEARSGLEPGKAKARRTEPAGACHAARRRISRPWPAKRREQQQGDDVGDLDHRVHRRAGGVLVGIADRVAGHRGLVGFGALAAVIAVLDILLGIVPGAAARGHRDGDEQAGDDHAEQQRAERGEALLAARRPPGCTKKTTIGASTGSSEGMIISLIAALVTRSTVRA